VCRQYQNDSNAQTADVSHVLGIKTNESTDTQSADESSLKVYKNSGYIQSLVWVKNSLVFDSLA